MFGQEDTLAPQPPCALTGVKIFLKAEVAGRYQLPGVVLPATQPSLGIRPAAPGVSLDSKPGAV